MVYKHAVVAAFPIFAQGCEVVAKRGGWSRCIIIVMEITLLIMENHGIVVLNFCGNPVYVYLTIYVQMDSSLWIDTINFG